MVIKNEAIVLCSGGIDSVVTSFYIKKVLKYKKITFLFFNYAQKALLNEIRCARWCARKIGADFKEINICELGKMSTSLINISGNIMKIKKNLKNTKKESDKWYVPCRNLIFLSYALAFAEAKFVRKKERSDIFVGFKCEGKESYPDTTIEFLESLNNVAKISCSYPIRIYAPLIDKDKEDIINIGIKLNIDFKKTWSCYIGKEKHCGKCLSCRLRKAGFYWSGINDATYYS